MTPFERYISGEPMTEDLFREMCMAHDLTYEYSDDHGVWAAGNQQRKLIEQARAQLPDEDARVIWNAMVRTRLRSPYIGGYLWL